MKKIAMIVAAMMVMAGAQSAMAHGDEHHHIYDGIDYPESSGA